MTCSGQIVDDKKLEDMLKEAGERINFTVFLTLFGERLTGTDTEETVLGAFKMFDPKDTGKLGENEYVIAISVHIINDVVLQTNKDLAKQAW
jgi:Ca2+-binding EF-hand superfamily protein